MLRAAAAGLAAAALVAGLVGAGSQTAGFVVRPIVSDHTLADTTRDPQLVNAWGLAAMPQGPWWVANEGRGSRSL